MQKYSEGNWHVLVFTTLAFSFSSHSNVGLANNTNRSLSHTLIP